VKLRVGLSGLISNPAPLVWVLHLPRRPNILCRPYERNHGCGCGLSHRWTAASYHRGEVMDFAPTGKRITFHGLASLRIVDGKIVRFEGFSDMLETLSSVP
jgi:hypothetical protein